MRPVRARSGVGLVPGRWKPDQPPATHLPEPGAGRIVAAEGVSSRRSARVLPRAYRGKRALDVILTVIALILLWPLLLGLALLVASRLGRPILFRQWRAGYAGRPFLIYKFRTMREATDSSGRILPEEERLTRFGRALRASSLDELPELFNILRGEMSLVGPRPLLLSYLPRYNARQARRHDVRPGLTGWAQVNGRTALSWAEKFDLDLWYTERQSVLLDLHILVLTVWKATRREGVAVSGQWEEFQGGT